MDSKLLLMGLMNHIKHFAELNINYGEKIKIKLFVCLKNNYRTMADIYIKIFFF